MRLQALAGVVAMTVGALVYDPALVNRLLSWLAIDQVVSQQVTMRFPIYLTLLLAIGAFFATIGLQERGNGETVSLATMRKAFLLTIQAGRWILNTPFALAVILLGMFYDHLLRLIITLASQYFRLIQLPEASFGMIMASFSLLGLLVPKCAEWLVERFSPAVNCGLLGLLMLTTLWGLSGFFPYLGVLPMAGVMIGLLLTSFFTSHYLNRATASAQRATVLSFKGLLFNLAYGLIGVLFALLIGHVRSGLLLDKPPLSPELLENESFRQSFSWFPWYGLVLGLLLTAISYRILHARSSSAGEA
jgi:hypothetical protein